MKKIILFLLISVVAFGRITEEERRRLLEQIREEKRVTRVEVKEENPKFVPNGWVSLEVEARGRQSRGRGTNQEVNVGVNLNERNSVEIRGNASREGRN